MNKQKLVFLSITFIMFPLIAFSQQKVSYTRMNGRWGNKAVTGNFQHVGSSMEGSYSYSLYVDDSLVHLSPIVQLYGDLDKHNKVVLKDLTGHAARLSGLFTDQRFTGKWNSLNSTQLPFTLTESYPKGSIPMDVFYLHSEKELVPKAQGTPSAQIELTLLYPKKDAHVSAAVVDSVKKFIQNQFFGEYKPAQLPAALLSRTEQNFYNQFAEFNIHWKTNRKLAFNLEKKENVSVLFNSYYLLCLQYKKTGYAGRGAPLKHITYDLIDLRNGEKLTPDNIFKTGTKKLITELINKKIRKYNNLADTVSLKTIGFYNDSIPLTGNIAFEGNGIIFVYNIFDVAPPAKGIQRIFLPFSEIGKFIKPGSVLYPLSRQGT